MSLIRKGLLIGNYKDAEDLVFLQTYGVTHILCAAKELQPVFPRKFTYKHVQADDVPSFNLLKYFDVAAEFIEAALASGDTVFVHCAAGISRSVTLVLAYFIRFEDMRVGEAYNLVKSRRHFVNPNPGFMKQLREYESRLQFAKSRTRELSSPQTHTKSRQSRPTEKQPARLFDLDPDPRLEPVYSNDQQIEKAKTFSAGFGQTARVLNTISQPPLKLVRSSASGILASESQARDSGRQRAYSRQPAGFEDRVVIRSKPVESRYGESYLRSEDYLAPVSPYSRFAKLPAEPPRYQPEQRGPVYPGFARNSSAFDRYAHVPGIVRSGFGSFTPRSLYSDNLSHHRVLGSAAKSGYLPTRSYPSDYY